jgi:hypothetical protein
MDFFIAELYKRGVYANLNLHVARKLSPADGLPDSVRDIRFDFDKRVGMFSRRMIELQKEFARDLLAHRNPYTGRTYSNDPGVLCVEVTNENSARWFDDGSELTSLPEPFAGELRARWNAWLHTKYASARPLQESWSGGSVNLGVPMLGTTGELGGWAREASPAAQLEVEAIPNGLRASVAKVVGAAWSAQLHQRGLSLQAGRAYTMSGRARSKDSRAFVVTAMLDEPDWRVLGLSRTVTATPEWKEFALVFEPAETVAGKARLSIQLGDATGEVELADLSLRAGAVGVAPSTEDFAARRVPLPRNLFGAVRRDWLEFLTDLEVGYADEMRGFLRRDLGVKSLVAISQVDYGGLTGLHREAGSDWTDKHEYWDHPAAASGWDVEKLTFTNTAMTPHLGGSNTLSNASQWRVAGRPFAMSEYNHPFPNEFDAECVPLLALGASWQDWDAVYFHEWGASPLNKDAAARIGNPFTMWNAVSKMAFVPPMAVLFRTHQIAPAPQSVSARLPAQRDAASLGRSIQSVWSSANPTMPPVWQARRQLLAPSAPKLNGASRLTAEPRSSAASTVAPGKVVWSDGKAQGSAPAHVAVDAPGAQVLAGSLGGRAWKTSRLSLNVGACPNNFAAVSLSALDGRPLESSPRVLLAVVSRIQNTGMKFRDDRKSAPTYGTGPVLVEVPSLEVELQTNGPRRVQVLDGTGRALREVAARFENGTLKFATSGSDKTVWYSIAPR